MPVIKRAVAARSAMTARRDFIAVSYCIAAQSRGCFARDGRPHDAVATFRIISASVSPTRTAQVPPIFFGRCIDEVLHRGNRDSGAERGAGWLRFRQQVQQGELADNYQAWALDGDDLVLYSRQDVVPAAFRPVSSPLGFPWPSSRRSSA